MKTKLVGLLFILFAVAGLVPFASAQDAEIQSGDIDVTSGDKAYKSYLAAPTSTGTHPAIVLVHSFRGLEHGYRTMVDQLAARGYVTLAIGWQTFEQAPSDAVVQKLVEDGIALLSARADVDKARIGLTGFCAGGRYTMLFMPQVSGFKAGVAWYGFPDRASEGGKAPKDFINDLKMPMLIIHGTEDQASPIAGIYAYATALAAVKAPFEMKIYAGEPHGFMIQNGELLQDDIGKDAFNEMADYFDRKL
ncbi:MAG: dienelactone hydrolase family protein [Anaerolineae bacterium]|nr:dienelactone hydrolase family protein [Anaerolineae bacterium]